MGDECRLASSEYQINGERRNLDVLINGYLERGLLPLSCFPFPPIFTVISVRNLLEFS